MRALLPFVTLALAAPSAAWADGTQGARAPLPFQPVPACDAAREGAAACLAGRQCLCRREGEPPAPRWDCGILRPSCTEAPADLAQARAGPLPFPWTNGPDWSPAEERGTRRRRAPGRE